MYTYYLKMIKTKSMYTYFLCVAEPELRMRRRPRGVGARAPAEPRTSGRRLEAVKAAPAPRAVGGLAPLEGLRLLHPPAARGVKQPEADRHPGAGE